MFLGYTDIKVIHKYYFLSCQILCIIVTSKQCEKIFFAYAVKKNCIHIFILIKYITNLYKKHAIHRINK
jgi:hypothetical protein